MCRAVGGCEFLLTKKARVADRTSDAETSREILDLVFQRPLASEDQFGVWVVLPELGEGLQGDVEALLFDEARCLDHAPGAIGRWGMDQVRETFHRHSGPVDADPRRVASKLHESGGERLAAGKDEGDRFEQAAKPVVITRLFVAQHNVHAMERDEGRL